MFTVEKTLIKNKRSEALHNRGWAIVSSFSFNGGINYSIVGKYNELIEEGRNLSGREIDALTTGFGLVGGLRVYTCNQDNLRIMVSSEKCIKCYNKECSC